MVATRGSMDLSVKDGGLPPDSVVQTIDEIMDVTTKPVILDGDTVVGVMLSDWACHPTPCFPGDSVCTWDAEDNNGAGYKTREEYRYLACVSPDFKKE